MVKYALQIISGSGFSSRFSPQVTENPATLLNLVRFYNFMESGLQKPLKSEVQVESILEFLLVQQL